MNLVKRLNSLVELGKRLTPENEMLQAIVRRTAFHNAWFTEANQWQAIGEICTHFLDRTKLDKWANNTDDSSVPRMKTVGLILAGNIPLVGFHDIICVYVAGHKSLMKLSEKDPYLMPFILKTLEDIDAETTNYFEIVEGLMKDFEVVIATGSNNSARYFDAYFGKYPNIIRKNRNAVAILRGDENNEDFEFLGKDIFSYFGLGCRNVSKLYLPRGYNFEPLLEVLHEGFKDLVLHDKYKNNFDYNFTLLILNKVAYQSNGCILMRENEAIASPIACLHYEYYDDFTVLSETLKLQYNEIQCVVSKEVIVGLPCFGFGEAQKPSLSDYADGVDTMSFLKSLEENSTLISNLSRQSF
jgi:Acyl-CoA reductase (LuxC)